MDQALWLGDQTETSSSSNETAFLHHHHRNPVPAVPPRLRPKGRSIYLCEGERKETLSFRVRSLSWLFRRILNRGRCSVRGDAAISHSVSLLSGAACSQQRTLCVLLWNGGLRSVSMFWPFSPQRVLYGGLMQGRRDMLEVDADLGMRHPQYILYCDGRSSFQSAAGSRFSSLIRLSFRPRSVSLIFPMQVSGELLECAFRLRLGSIRMEASRSFCCRSLALERRSQ